MWTRRQVQFLAAGLVVVAVIAGMHVELAELLTHPLVVRIAVVIVGLHVLGGLLGSRVACGARKRGRRR